MVVLEFLFSHFCVIVKTVQEPFECWPTVLELANPFKNWFSSRMFFRSHSFRTSVQEWFGFQNRSSIAFLSVQEQFLNVQELYANSRINFARAEWKVKKKRGYKNRNWKDITPKEFSIHLALWVKFSADNILKYFLIFPEHQDLPFHANCLQ